jgi:hypothetical protein
VRAEKREVGRDACEPEMLLEIEKKRGNTHRDRRFGKKLKMSAGIVWEYGTSALRVRHIKNAYSD